MPPKTVKIIVCLALDGAGNWHAIGSSKMAERDAMREAIKHVGDGEKQVQLVAEIELPAKELPLPEPSLAGVPWE